MKDIHRKAFFLYLDGKVTLHNYIVEPRGTFLALGHVEGDHGTYRVELTGDRPACECEYATKCPGVVCSHARALELAVFVETREAA